MLKPVKPLDGLSYLLMALTGYQGNLSGRWRALLESRRHSKADRGSPKAERGPFRQSEVLQPQRGPVILIEGPFRPTVGPRSMTEGPFSSKSGPSGTLRLK